MEMPDVTLQATRTEKCGIGTHDVQLVRGKKYRPGDFLFDDDPEHSVLMALVRNGHLEAIDGVFFVPNADVPSPFLLTEGQDELNRRFQQLTSDNTAQATALAAKDAEIAALQAQLDAKKAKANDGKKSDATRAVEAEKDTDAPAVA